MTDKKTLISNGIPSKIANKDGCGKGLFAAKRVCPGIIAGEGEKGTKKSVSTGKREAPMRRSFTARELRPIFGGGGGTCGGGGEGSRGKKRRRELEKKEGKRS